MNELNSALAKDPTLGEKHSLKVEVDVTWSGEEEGDDFGGGAYSGTAKLYGQSSELTIYKFNWKRARAAGFTYFVEQPPGASEWLIFAGPSITFPAEIRYFIGEYTERCVENPTGNQEVVKKGTISASDYLSDTTTKSKSAYFSSIGTLNGAEISEDEVTLAVTTGTGLYLVFQQSLCGSGPLNKIIPPIGLLGTYPRELSFEVSYEELSKNSVEKTTSTSNNALSATVRFTLGPPDPCDPLSEVTEGVDYGIADLPVNPRTGKRRRAETDHKTGVILFDRGSWDRSSGRQKAATWLHEREHQLDQKAGTLGTEPAFISEWRGWKAAADYIQQCVDLNDPSIPLTEAAELAIRKAVIYKGDSTLRPLHEVRLLLRQRGYQL